MGTFFKQLFATIIGIVLSLVLFIVAIIVAVALLAGDLFSSSAQPLERGTLLEISMNEMIVDAPVTSPLGNFQVFALNTPPATSILDLSLALECAVDDPNITAISLRMDGSERLSLATASEVRDLLGDFSDRSGKPIYAYAESYEQVEYLLASIADSLFLNPQGAISWQGVAVNGLYYGDLLSELDVKAEVFRPASCSYKSAVEPYISNQMSTQSREQNQRIVSTFWDSIVREVSLARKISEQTLRRVAKEQIVVEAEQALDSRMVDALCYRDQYDQRLENLGVVRGSNNAPRRVSMSRYAESVRQRLEESNLAMGGDNKIAVIYANGAIVDGDLQSASQEDVVSGVIARQLRRARNDEDVKAVILRVNSPGGSALAADVIWREVSLVREEKPLIVSFGSYAASGGYYISAPADIILTSRYTLTGSIGVFGVMFAVEDALRSKLKVSMDGVVSSPSADFGVVSREASPIERAAMMRSVDKVYETFCSSVEQGRHLSARRVAELGGGRVWSGAEAVANGLADGEGGVRQALLLAKERCGLGDENVEIVEYMDGVDNWSDMLSEMLFGGVSTSLLVDVKRLLEHDSGVMMLTPERVNF